MDGSGADCRILQCLELSHSFYWNQEKEKNTFKESGGDPAVKYSTENEVEKARAMMEALEQESKEEIEE